MSKAFLLLQLSLFLLFHRCFLLSRSCGYFVTVENYIVVFLLFADSCVGLVMELAMSEMFGTVAEEKDIKKITGKVAEAKGTKSYDSIQIVARYHLI